MGSSSDRIAEGRLKTLAFILRFEGRKRVHNADEIMAIAGPKRGGAVHSSTR